MKKIVCILILITLIIPANTIAQQQTESVSDQQQAHADAMFDAQNASTEIWMGAGCLFGVFGIAAAYLMPSSAPPYRLLGKTPNYITTYVNVYKSEVKIEKTKAAVGGCVVGTALSWYLIYVVEIPTPFH